MADEIITLNPLEIPCPHCKKKLKITRTIPLNGSEYGITQVSLVKDKEKKDKGRPE